jgi:replicative DNA helicase
MNKNNKFKKSQSRTNEVAQNSGLELGKVPPQALELEAAVLGALLIDPALLTDISQILSAECFYSEKNAQVFEAIQQLSAEQSPIDLLTVAERLNSAGKLDTIGGESYLIELTQKVASGAHADYHARIIFQKYVKRMLISAGTTAVSVGFSDDVSIDDAMLQVEASISEINQNIAGKRAVRSIRTIVEESINLADERVKLVLNRKNVGISTGLKNLNEILVGFLPAKLYLLAARPSMGKTAVMLKFIKSAAEQGNHCAVFSLEMKDVSLADRLILSECNVESYRYTQGFINDDEYRQLEAAAGKIAKLPISIDDRAGITMKQIHDRAKVLKNKGKCDIVFIDYLGLCREQSEFNRNREQAVAEMSLEAKNMAKNLNVPVVLLSQLSREVEKRGDRKPQLSDLRDSGSIEQDADVVIFVWRPDYYKSQVEMVRKSGDEFPSNYGQLIVRKNRDGKLGKAEFSYNNSMTKIMDYEEKY